MASSDAGSLLIHVRDQGEGFAVSDPEVAFDKFKRFKSADRSRPGTGLGLAISRGFIEAMGGTIVARNRQDRSGAELIMTFPLNEKNTK